MSDRPLRVIVAARVRNDDDLIEAFVRHHAALADGLVLLDNGSNDRTPAILAALKQEGLPLSLYRAASTRFVESAHNTFLLRQAMLLGADWVLHLDVDEFIDLQHLGGGLAAHLAAVPAASLCLAAELVNYQPTAADEASELVVPRRLRWRDRAASGVTKMLVRAVAARMGARLAHGSHSVTLDGATLPALRDPLLPIGHFPMRSGWQMLAKAVVGRLKVLASGAAEVQGRTAQHYTNLLENLDRHPEWLLLNGTFMGGLRPPERAGELVEDPFGYLGGPLRHTVARDPRLHAARSLLGHLEELAASHGRLMDEVAEARHFTEVLEGEIRQVF